MQGLTTLVRIPCSVDIPDDCLEDRIDILKSKTRTKF